ncbi:MAG: hypothetical protein KAV00_15035 [Phycisphaerae bacterium]|nr:hypothetical protein [Phycisphaerae bacterium]
MADFEVGDIIRIGAAMTYDGSEDVVNVYHVELTAGGPLAWGDMTAKIQAYMDLIMATLDTELSTLMTANVLQVSNVTQATVFGAIAWGDFAQGGAAGAQCAAGAACFGFIRTRVPRVQMRKYYGVFPQAALVDGAWDAGVTDAVGDALAVHMADTLAGSGVYFEGVAYNRTLLTTAKGVTVAVKSEPAYQRRRKRGVGS